MISIGHSISFLPGASGRFLSNLLYSLLNNLDTNMTFCEANSAHLMTLASNPKLDYSVLKQPMYREINVFKKLRFLPANYHSVFSTHSYPYTSDLNINPYVNTFKMIIIGISESNLLEINTNHFTKNIYPALNTAKTKGFDHLSIEDKTVLFELTNVYSQHYKTPLHIYKLDTYEVLEKLVKIHAFMNQTAFIKLNIDPKYLDRTLVIQYDDLFIKSRGEYKALSMLSEWVEKKPSLAIKQSYNNYVLGRQKIINNNLFLKKTLLKSCL